MCVYPWVLGPRYCVPLCQKKGYTVYTMYFFRKRDCFFCSLFRVVMCKQFSCRIVGLKSVQRMVGQNGLFVVVCLVVCVCSFNMCRDHAYHFVTSEAAATQPLPPSNMDHPLVLALFPYCHLLGRPDQASMQYCLNWVLVTLGIHFHPSHRPVTGSFVPLTSFLITSFVFRCVDLWG